MFYGNIGSNYVLLRLEKGEEVISSLTKFCKSQRIDNAYFSGLGSIENPTLAHYKVSTKKYSEKKIEGIFELLTITGNVALFNDEPLIHSHVIISDEEMQTRGGHLVSATVSATVEIHLRILDSVYTKSQDEEIGLKLFDLPEKLS